MKWLKSLFVFLIVLSLSTVPGCSGDSMVNPNDDDNGNTGNGEQEEIA